jgi:hypothetical protein
MCENDNGIEPICSSSYRTHSHYLTLGLTQVPWCLPPSLLQGFADWEDIDHWFGEVGVI